MPEPCVHVVDDDGAMRRSIAFLAESVGWVVQTHESAEAFLAAGASRPGCLVLDIRMPTMSGLELQRELQRRGDCPPIVFISGHADIAMAVQAMREGALDFLEKPFRDQQLLDAIARAMRVAAQRQAEAARRAGTERLRAALTPREREVAERAARGLPSKRIARELGISDKTVQVHRANLMKKLGVHSAAELAQRLPPAEGEASAPPPPDHAPG